MYQLECQVCCYRPIAEPGLSTPSQSPPIFREDQWTFESEACWESGNYGLYVYIYIYTMFYIWFMGTYMVYCVIYIIYTTMGT